MSRGPQAHANSELLRESYCSCTNCSTTFCTSKIFFGDICNKRICRNNKTSVFFVDNKPRTDMTGLIDIGRAKADKCCDKVRDLQVDSEELIKTFSKQSCKSIPEVRNTVEDLNKAESDNTHAHKADVHSLATSYSRKNMSTTTAELSAQVMNLPIEEFKESISREKPVPHEKPEKPEKVVYTTNEIIRRIKEAYDACTCKICECLIGRSTTFQSVSCNCEPCNCQDCANLKTIVSNATVNLQVRKLLKDVEQTECERNISAKCQCTPCECLNCSDTHPKMCKCKLCQCADDKFMNSRRKTIIVAPVGENTQRTENCLCSPCDCVRCSQHRRNVSHSRVHEISTGNNRHPNCQCETCMNEACEPNNTNTCRCETQRGVTSKPVNKNTNDFDIHTAKVYNKRDNNTREKYARSNPISMYAAVKHNTYSFFYQTLLNRQKRQVDSKALLNEQKCKCSPCECIVCECQGHDLNKSKTGDNSSKLYEALKPPSTASRVCQCSPCESKFCSYKKQSLSTAPIKYNKDCSCEICNCMSCVELLKSNKINGNKTVKRSCSTSKSECRSRDYKNCQSKHEIQKSELYYCNICRRKHCADKCFASDGKSRQRNTVSVLQHDNEVISSEPELRKMSKHTQLKHSKAQLNVFECELSFPKTSKQNLTLFYAIPEFNRFSCKRREHIARAWIFGRSNLNLNSENIMDTRLPEKNISYDRALFTLQRAKEFSLELMNILHKYEMANLQFESISKKLKESHDSILNGSFHERNRKFNVKKTYKFLTKIKDYESENDKLKNYLSSSSQTLTNKNISLIYKHPSTLLDNTVIEEEHRETDEFGFISKIKKNRAVGAIMTGALPAQYNDIFQCRKCKAIIDNGFDKDFVADNQNKQMNFVNVVDEKVNIPNKEPSSAEIIGNNYENYKNFTKLPLHIARRMIEEYPTDIYVQDNLPTHGKTIALIEAGELKKIIKDEMRSVFKQLIDVSKEKELSKCVNEEANESMNIEEVTKQPVESKVEIIDPKGGEAQHTTLLRNSLNSRDSSKPSRLIQSSCEDMKVDFVEIRKVSDHTVMVKWKVPKQIRDVQGYEILVDGRPVQTILSPTRTMAVVTGLVHSERILLTIRTVTKSGILPCSNIVYQPRAK